MSMPCEHFSTWADRWSPASNPTTATSNMALVEILDEQHLVLLFVVNQLVSDSTD
jgi:hypothetical protein